MRVDLRSKRRQAAALLMAQDALEEQGYSLEWETVDDGYRYALRDQEQEIVNVAWSACRGRFYGNS